MKRRIVPFLVGVLTALVPVLIIQRAPTDKPSPLREWLRRRPAGYANAGYWTPSMVDEAIGVGEELGIGYVLPKDTTGEFINVKDGYRVTVGQPGQYRYTIWLVGNSAMFDPYLPDAYTTASQLQRLYADVRVINAGVNADDLTRQKNRLQEMPIQPGDVILFYDGLSEAYNFTEQQYETDRAEKAIHDAKRIAADRGARFVHVLQDHALSVEMEWDIAVALDTVWAGKVAKFTVGIRDVYQDLRRIDPGVKSAEGCLSDYRAKGNVVFVDLAHIGDPVAAGILAQCLKDFIEGK